MGISFFVCSSIISMQSFMIDHLLSPVHLVQRKQLPLVSQIFSLNQSRKTLVISYRFSTLIQKKILAHQGELEFFSKSIQKNISNLVLFLQFDLEENSSSPGGAVFSRPDIPGSDPKSFLSGLSNSVSFVSELTWEWGKKRQNV